MTKMTEQIGRTRQLIQMVIGFIWGGVMFGVSYAALFFGALAFSLLMMVGLVVTTVSEDADTLIFIVALLHVPYGVWVGYRHRGTWWRLVVKLLLRTLGIAVLMFFIGVGLGFLYASGP